MSIATAITYEPFGPVNALTHGNGVTVALGYDLDGRLSAMDAYNGGTPVLDLDYSYDLAGNITGIADIGGGNRSRTYGYDALHRLTSATLPDEDLVYTYDAVGNRTGRLLTQAKTTTETYAIDALSNRLDGVTIDIPRNKGTPAQTILRTLTYSASGNVTMDDLAGSAMTLTYNAADRLVRVGAGAVTLVEYVYSATGQRAIKATPTATTHYLHDPGGALYDETDGAGTTLREYITLGGATIAIIDAGGLSFVHNDHLATPQVMTDGTAAVVWDASYRPFGEATIAGAAANAQRFPGQTADAETGYSDNWHRTYDPSLGRYLQSDPIGIMAGFNTYGYAGGNPVMYADPTGQIFFVVFLGTAADAVGLGLTLYAVGDYGLRWHDNYCAGGCRALWGARPAISAWDVAFLLAGPTAKAGKLAFRSFGKAAPRLDKSWKQLIVGRGQATGTPGHRFRSYREAIRMAKSGNYKAVHLDRPYYAALRMPRPKAGNPLGRRPDVLGVRRNGRVDAIEVPSKTDIRKWLIERNEIAMGQLPSHMQGEILLKLIK